MTLRASLEAVLRKHSKCCDPAYPGHPTPYVVQVKQELLDDLLVCVQQYEPPQLVAPCSGSSHPEGPRILICENELNKLRHPPQPSREALEKIFIRHAHRYPSSIEWENAIKTDLMAWATGQRERVWCEHILWKDYRKTDSYEGWIFTASINGSSKLPLSWVICPLCAAPRPEDA